MGGKYLFPPTLLSSLLLTTSTQYGGQQLSIILDEEKVTGDPVLAQNTVDQSRELPYWTNEQNAGQTSVSQVFRIIQGLVVGMVKR
jgi:hypothetical protein